MIPGVLRTRVGYAGGTSRNPTYRKIGDHTECVQMDFDTSEITYEELLDRFWRIHNPHHPPYSRQYRSIILYHTPEQEMAAKASKAQLEEERGQAYTEILPFEQFYLAEGYHQKYYLRRADQIMAEVERRYSNLQELVASHEVARLNGYVSGHGSQAQLESELSSFGLSPAATRRLEQIVEGFGR